MPTVLAGAAGKGALPIAVAVFFATVCWQEVDVGRVDDVALDWLEWRKSCHVETF